MRLLADTPPPAGAFPTLAEMITTAYATDPLAQEVLRDLRSGNRHNRSLSLADFQEVDGRLRYQNRLYIPDNAELRLRLLRSRHDALAAGHPGRDKTFELLTRS